MSSSRIGLISTLRDCPIRASGALGCTDPFALLCAAESFEDIELFGEANEPRLSTFLETPHGIPSHDTFNRLFAALDPQRFKG